MLRVRLRVRVERVGVVGAALRDAGGDVLERLAALVGELEGDVRRVAAGLVVEVLLRVLDVGAGEARVVADDPEGVGVGRVGGRLLVAQDEDARLDLDDLGLFLLGVAEAVERLGARRARDALVERLLGDLVERVEPRGRGRLAVLRHLDLALRRPLDRVVETGDGLLAAVDLGVVGLAVLVEDVLLPVVEEELGGRPDLARGALGVLDAREVDLDLVLARARELGLGHAEGVDAVAHDVQRALERFGVDRRLLGRLALVDELDATLEVEAELGRLGQDRDRGSRDQAEDDQQNKEMATAFGHPGGRGQPTSTASARAGARRRRHRPETGLQPPSRECRPRR